MQPRFQGRNVENRGKTASCGNGLKAQTDGRRQGTRRQERWKDEMGKGFRHVNEPLARRKQDRTNVWKGDARLAFDR